MQFVPYFDKSLFHGVDTVYLCLNYWYKGTLVHCRTCSMQMLSVLCFEISHKRRGDFFFKYVLHQKHILEWYEVPYFRNCGVCCRPLSQLHLLVRNWSYELLCLVIFLSLETIWFWIVPKSDMHIRRWELNREKYCF